MCLQELQAALRQTTLEQQNSSAECSILHAKLRSAEEQLKEVSGAYTTAQQQLITAVRRLQRARAGGAKAAKAAAGLVRDLSAAGGSGLSINA
jgi:chromosome segregation ATPase